MQNIAEVLQHKYGMGGWMVQDDGDGAYIREWTRPEPQPSPEELGAWHAEMVAARTPTPADQRAARYRVETDPLLTLIQARRLEGRVEEADALTEEWTERRAQIRADIPG